MAELFRTRALAPAAARGAFAAAALAAFVAAVDMVRTIRPALLFGWDPAWLIPQALLWIAVLGATVAAAVAFFLGVAALSRSPLAGALPALPLGGGAIVSIALVAFVVGAALRLAALERVPAILYVDDVSLVTPALALRGAPQDFSDAIRPAPFGGKSVYGSVGVLYLEGYRLALRLAGTSVLGVRLPSALGGVASLATAALLGRALLPAGGGALTLLVLAGLRWQLILSRWGWNMIVLAPVLDVAALLAIKARRGARGAGWAALAGAVAGLGAHVYLSAWTGGAALLLVAAWPRGDESARRGLARGATFGLGFAAAVLPIFLLAEGRQGSYFARTKDHNIWKEMRYTRSRMPPFAAAADSIGGPWFVPDPTPRNDLPGRTRLGWLSIPLALAFARALVRPRDDLSALLLAHAGTALGSSVLGGEALLPNGCRFGYLTGPTAIGIAAGLLALLAAVPEEKRRLAALAGLGAVAVTGALGARDALVRWAGSRAYFDDIFGQDTLVARAALRLDRFGEVEIAPRVVHATLVVDGIRAHRLDPDERRRAVMFGPPRPTASRRFRIALPGSRPSEGERELETLRDGWGREWAVVFGSAVR